MKNKTVVLETIKYALWGIGETSVDEGVYNELETHKILGLPAPVFSKLSISPEVYGIWKTMIIQQMVYYENYIYAQDHISIRVPYVILKGTAAAKYYQYPQYRSMGDIDIFTRREDFYQAYQNLIDDGYKVTKELIREVSFCKNNVTIELHKYFASLNDPAMAKYMDDLIIDNINPSHILPDQINGLVLLEHINQHLEEGIGLRQIIDWMMFVDKCLPDEKWPDFYEMVANIGLDKLAIAVTYMCELYLGLPERNWCSNADTSICEHLMDYILSCGNFGCKRTSDVDISENVFAHTRTFKAVYKLLQKQGLYNWEAAQKHAYLKPFAWIYQLFRYAFRGIKQRQATIMLKKEYHAGKKRAELFDSLGVKSTAKGLVVYRNGKYAKEK